MAWIATYPESVRSRAADQLGEVSISSGGDHPQQRVDPEPGLHRQRRRGEQLLPARAEQIAHRDLRGRRLGVAESPASQLDERDRTLRDGGCAGPTSS
jgi:hypothetical protein